MPAYDADLFSSPAPVSRVTLRNPQTGRTISDIPLLIDSGADVTLVPQSAVDALGIALDIAETYQLQSFDRRVSTAHAVNLELHFLRRTFRGKFLVIEKEYGLLGRDVLNYVSIVFDGPRLIWEESTGQTR
jgi:predicted aspartyl protease